MNYVPIHHFSYCVVPYNFSYSWCMIWMKSWSTFCANHLGLFRQTNFISDLWKLFGKLYSLSVLSILTSPIFPSQGVLIRIRNPWLGKMFIFLPFFVSFPELRPFELLCNIRPCSNSRAVLYCCKSFVISEL